MIRDNTTLAAFNSFNQNRAHLYLVHRVLHRARQALHNRPALIPLQTEFYRNHRRDRTLPRIRDGLPLDLAAALLVTRRTPGGSANLRSKDRRAA